MNTNPDSIKILCYGDSNTWGYMPKTKNRYGVDVRWTGVLQNMLGDNYWVIEEGLNSRTTVLNYVDRVWKNGKTYLRPCLESQLPLDILILFLGTNDLKDEFDLSAEQISKNVSELIDISRDVLSSFQSKPFRTILISPTVIDFSVSGVDDKYTKAEKNSHDLGMYYEQVANEKGCEFIDLAKHILPSKIDGYHLDPESHKKIAELLFDKIKKN